jgi:hypothetical protein
MIIPIDPYSSVQGTDQFPADHGGHQAAGFLLVFKVVVIAAINQALDH